ncbi:DUF448 domain-containing protein [Sphingomonas jatrophae]|uniref:YlxR domain-containing protein n=1 Tax=Sphingomonas jatrophae TaxID=1166337 RepID=A0A1I6JQC9_9SPHN|nr:DUF448 domain-containing protein [Sphingomonas jatrophae]SFR81157.1 hypothetical protein SAMN05192580_0671 [Sphingomonas jatrophae]
MAHDEILLDLTDEGDAPPAKVAHTPERTCIITREKGARDALIRLALAPDGSVAPDVRARAPGRGAWIGADRATLERAIAKGKLKGALARAFKGAPLTIPADLPDRIEQALARATLDRLGLEARAGTLLTGSDRISDAARKGQVSLLLHADDAAEDGNRKLDQAWRVGLDREGEAVRGLVIPASRSILSMAVGRENVVHIALTAPAAAARVSETLRRWCGFIGRDGGEAPCEAGSQGTSALRRGDGPG